VADAELGLDDVGDALEGPNGPAKAVGLGAAGEEEHPPEEIALGELRRASGMLARSQLRFAAAPIRPSPARDGRGITPKGAGDRGDREALVERAEGGELDLERSGASARCASHAAGSTTQRMRINFHRIH
jgi:hypothetical protein